jgi:MoxR-like ATPase
MMKPVANSCSVAALVFANVVLADEIDRATPKTQSALLEVMDRARVSVDGETPRNRSSLHGVRDAESG